jgi:ribonuclease HI
VLFRRHIERIAFCEDCGDPEESIQHALMGCSVAKRFWHQVRLGTGVKIPSLNPETWATDIISGVCSERDTVIILCSMWALWMMRNKRRHGEQPMNDHQAMTWARDTAHDLWQLSQELKPRIDRPERPKWSLPKPGWVKINSDAAFQAAGNVGATACIIRDHQGAFRVAQARWYERSLDACMMESLACRDGLELAKQHGEQRVILETDCLELVNLWKKEAQRSVIDPVLQEIQNLCLAFQDFSFVFVNRCCNKIAHVLAKQVSNTRCLETWHVTPACVADLVMFEASAG